MDFLNKLYESDYFGIGLFAVISFLVVTFLIVLFFGKRDAKKRKLEATNNLKVQSSLNEQNTFKEISTKVPLDLSVAPTALEPSSTVLNEPIQPIEQLMPVEPVNPINLEAAPIEPVSPLQFDSIPIEPVAPIKLEDSIITKDQAVTPIINEPQIAPINNMDSIKLEPIKFNVPSEPKVMEPIKIDIPIEPPKNEPIIKEEIKPMITPIENNSPIIEEPVIKETYYNPIHKVQTEEIKVPNIDFDAIAQSISKELDELEKSSNNAKYEEVKVTPINEVTSTPKTSQFSSVYVNDPVKPMMELPKKIELPTKKNENIEPESYNI